MKVMKGVEKITNLKYLNMYQITYNKQSKEFKYMFASRRDEKSLECLGKSRVDAVRMLPYYYKNGEMQIVLIKEFRHALNKYIYGIPAGLVDNNESAENAAKRELLEEIGARVLNINKLQNASFTSAGLTDENVECYSAEVELLAKQQQLDEIEDIKIVIVNENELLNFIDENLFCLQSALMLKMFVYKNKCERRKEGV